MPFGKPVFTKVKLLDALRKLDGNKYVGPMPCWSAEHRFWGDLVLALGQLGDRDVGNTAVNRRQAYDLYRKSDGSLSEEAFDSKFVQFQTGCVAISWGGEIQGPRKTVKMINTCPVDTGLQVLQVLTKTNPRVAEYFKSLGTERPVFVFVNRAVELVSLNSSDKARYLWGKLLLRLPDETGTMNFYGSEPDRFLAPFYPLQERTQTKSCNYCSRLETTALDAFLTLAYDRLSGNPPEEQLSEMIGTFERTCRGCKVGIETVKRSFVGDPEILCLRFESRATSLENIPGELEIGGQVYQTAAITFIRGQPKKEHFDAAIKVFGVWHWYDGLARPHPMRKARDQTIALGRGTSTLWVVKRV